MAHKICKPLYVEKMSTKLVRLEFTDIMFLEHLMYHLVVNGTCFLDDYERDICMNIFHSFQNGYKKRAY